MYLKMFLNLFLVFLAVLSQISFIGKLPLRADQLNLLLVVILFVLVLFDFRFALVWALGGGFLFDLFSFLPFGFFMLVWLMSLYAAKFLLDNFLTNRSLYSLLVLGAFLSFVYNFLFYTFGYAVEFFEQSYIFLLERVFWLNIIFEIIVNSIIIIAVFQVISFVSKKLNPVFLTRLKR